MAAPIAQAIADRAGQPWGHGSRLRGLLQEEQDLAKLYESFMRGLSRYLLGNAYRVRAKEPKWPMHHHSSDAAKWMPSMRTDVHIEHKVLTATTRTVGIIECKYYENPFGKSQYSDQDKWRNGHLYQQLAYMQAEVAVEPGQLRPAVRGTIAYAHHEYDFDETFELHGFPFRMVTVNLNLPWPELRARVEDVVRWSVASGEEALVASA